MVVVVFPRRCSPLYFIQTKALLTTTTPAAAHQTHPSPLLTNELEAVYDPIFFPPLHVSPPLLSHPQSYHPTHTPKFHHTGSVATLSLTRNPSALIRSPKSIIIRRPFRNRRRTFSLSLSTSELPRRLKKTGRASPTETTYTQASASKLCVNR